MFDRGSDSSDSSDLLAAQRNRGGRGPGLVAAPSSGPTGLPVPEVVLVTSEAPVVVPDVAEPLSPYVRSWRKRALDLVIGVPLALAAVPVVALLAVAMACSLRAWPFFVQQRVGREGHLFRMVKIRTLPRQTPRYASKYELGGVVTTRTGQWLRSTHLDEVPQLFLVVLGSMSLVGPRPEMAQLMDRFDQAEADLRMRVRPGCTGLWQVSEDAGKLIYEVPQYDRSYLQNARPSLDLFLLRSTVRCALRTDASVSFDDRFRDRFRVDI
jgi:lipopolysaccharide/colanic/teichoic acid biosynthesis glycosyltransferase